MPGDPDRGRGEDSPAPRPEGRAPRRGRCRGALDLSAVGDAPLRRLLAAQWTSLSGDFAMLAALPFIVYGLGGGPGEVGIAFAVGAASLVVLVLFGGVLADRHGRRRMMIVADLGRGATQTTLAVLLLAGTAHYWQVLLAEASIGSGAALAQPALTGLVAEIVDPGRRQGANALRGMLGSLAMLAGPALAGAAIVLGGPGVAVALDAASYAVSALLLIGLGTAPRRRAAPSESPPGAFHAELLAGWSEFSSRPWLWATVVSFAGLNMLVFGPFEVLGAQTAHASLGGAGAWSSILAAFGLGSLAGGLLALAWRPGRPLVAVGLLLLVWTPLLVLLALAAPLAAILGAAAVTGAGWLLLVAIWEATIQENIPGPQLSRVVSYDWLGSNALLPLGLLLAAPIGASLGVGTALLLSAAVAVAATGIVLAVPGVRRMARPTVPHDGGGAPLPPGTERSRRATP